MCLFADEHDGPVAVGFAEIFALICKRNRRIGGEGLCNGGANCGHFSVENSMNNLIAAYALELSCCVEGPGERCCV